MKTITYKIPGGLAKYWGLVLIAGIVLIILGAWLVIFPLQSYFSISLAFGIGIMLTGMFEVIFSLINQSSMRGWGWMLINGIIEFSIGAYLYSFPLLTMIILYLMIGIWLLLRGIVIIVNAYHMRGLGFQGSIWFLLEGVAVVLFALFILANFVLGFTNALIWIGFALIGAGIFRVYLSFKMHSLIKH